MKFANRTAVVTGAAVGIGRAVAHKLAMEGANVVILDYNPETVEKTRVELEAYTQNVLALVCDVSDEAAVNEMFARAKARFGKIDILINNAGIWRCWAPFMETSVEDWKRYLDINGIQLMDYSEDTAHLFQTQPMDETFTIFPAVIKDGNLEEYGRAGVKEA